MATDDGDAGLYLPSVPPDEAPTCACEAPPRRTVLDRGLDLTVEACLRCGETVGYLEFVDWIYPHPHDVRVVSVTPLRMDSEIGRWIARWPRLAGPTRAPAGRDDVWLAADARAEDETAAARLEAAAAGAQGDLPLVERLRRAGAPAEPPPAALPDRLEIWAAVHRAMAFSSASPFLDVLMTTAASSRSWLPAWIAADALTARPDRGDRLAAVLAGGDPEHRLRALRYVADAPLPADEIASLVLQECRNIRADLEALLDARARTVPPNVDNNFAAFAAALPRAMTAGGSVTTAIRQLHQRIAEVHQRRIHIPGAWRKRLNQLLAA